MIVNSASVTDPVTGESAINLPIEAVQSVEVLTNPYAPEYGQFTGAVTSVQTRSGSENVPRERNQHLSPLSSSWRLLCWY
jgi:hypothetical protein